MPWKAKALTPLTAASRRDPPLSGLVLALEAARATWTPRVAGPPAGAAPGPLPASARMPLTRGFTCLTCWMHEAARKAMPRASWMTPERPAAASAWPTMDFTALRATGPPGAGRPWPCPFLAASRCTSTALRRAPTSMGSPSAVPVPCICISTMLFGSATAASSAAPITAC